MNTLPILFSLFDNAITLSFDHEPGNITFRQFPDQETYVQINSDLSNRHVIFIANLADPNPKILPLIFALKTARALGALHITLVAPYLVYMRQDKQFHLGEGITSRYFSELLSQSVDHLITVDPHLHRYHSLNEIYTIKTTVCHAIDPIADWIKKSVQKPVIIGPDQESAQWAATIAQKIDVPYIILEKTRHGDRSVAVSLPHIEQYSNFTPVLIDDIISSGKTMLESIKQLLYLNMTAPVCIGIHAIFAENSYDELQTAGAGVIATCNTIPHPSNAIDIDPLIDAVISCRS